MPSDPIIDVAGLTKTFAVRRKAGRVRRRREEVVAVGGIDLQIERGAMVGYIGPNGAGKSTTIKMLTGILVPTAGHVRVDGLEPSRERTELARRIGVVFGQRSQLWWDLPLRDSFDLLRHVYSGARGAPRRQPAGASRPGSSWTRCSTSPCASSRSASACAASSRRPCSTTRRSCCSTSRPSGSTSISQEAVREFLVEINREQGTTVLLTTHDLVRRRAALRAAAHHRPRPRRSRTAPSRGSRSATDASAPWSSTSSSRDHPSRSTGAAVTRVDGPRQWLRFRRDDVSASELLSRVTSPGGRPRPVRGGTGHREHRAGDLRSVTMRTRPLTLAAVGLVAVGIDFRVVASDLLLDVRGLVPGRLRRLAADRAVGRRPRARRVDR